MPYLKEPDRRHSLTAGTALPQDGAELNYLICDIVDSFLRDKGLTYARLNEAMGAIECAKLEIYRRIAAPYEDIKLRENDDVFTVVPRDTADLSQRIISRL